MKKFPKNKRKKINRNAFNEKLIHRYFFERIYLNKKMRKNLVSEALQNKISKLNLVVPEDKTSPTYKNYTPDFTLYFKNDNNPYPVEIKWNSKDFKKRNQTREIKKNHGYLVCFDKGDKSKLNGVEPVQIDENDFKNWLVERIDTLFDESLSTKVKEKLGNKCWVVVKRGSGAVENFTKMKDHCKSEKGNFWAFENKIKSMKNILRLERGDKMIFLFVKTRGNERSGMIADSNTDLEIQECYFTKIEEPYYMVLDGKQAHFLEDRKNKNITERKYPHFFDFERERNGSFIFKNPINLSRKDMTKELKSKLAHSGNPGGSDLMELTTIEAEYLKGEIRKKHKGLN